MMRLTGSAGQAPRLHVDDMGVLSRYSTLGAGAALATLALAATPDRLLARALRAADLQEASYPTVHDRKPFEDATRSLRDEMRADPEFGPLIERIPAVP